MRKRGLTEVTFFPGIGANRVRKDGKSTTEQGQ